MNSKRLTDIFLFASIAIFIFGAGYRLGEHRSVNASSQAFQLPFSSNNTGRPTGNLPAEEFDSKLFWDTWRQLEEKYIDEKKLDRQKMFYGAIKGMVASVEDPYTFFLTPDENKQSKDDLGGKFQGIGAQLGLKNNQITVISPLKNSPAERAGIRSGDSIMTVDGQSTKGWTLTQAVSKIRGEEGTEVTLGLLRDAKEFDVKINRAQIFVPSVELTFEPQNGQQVAHLVVNQFGDTTTKEWDEAVETIAQQYKNGTVQGMVLDLRGNPGGYLDGAVYLASEFLPKGKLIVKQETTVGQDREYLSERNGILQDIPVVVLINEGSASASEILSGALRDHGRATLVGQKSFGKGSVQEALDLQGGAGLHVTIAKWILPKGDWINGKGIEPAIQVENKVEEGNTITKESDEQLKKALEEVLKK